MKNPLSFQEWKYQTKPIEFGIKGVLTDKLTERKDDLFQALKMMIYSSDKKILDEGMNPLSLDFERVREPFINGWGLIIRFYAQNGDTYGQYSEYLYTLSMNNYFKWNNLFKLPWYKFIFEIFKIKWSK